MIRKLFLDLRLVFPILPLFLIALTVEYSWAAQRAWIMVYQGDNSYGLEMWSDPPTGEAASKYIENFKKEHPQGQIISLREAPQSYFLGFGGMARFFLPF